MLLSMLLDDEKEELAVREREISGKETKESKNIQAKPGASDGSGEDDDATDAASTLATLVKYQNRTILSI